MEYALQLLERELYQIKSIIFQSNWDQYKEALENREKKVKQLEIAIKVLKENDNNIKNFIEQKNKIKKV